jgi:hypothetical protein
MLRIVPPTVPRVGRSDEHFPDGFELHLLPGGGMRVAMQCDHVGCQCISLSLRGVVYNVLFFFFFTLFTGPRRAFSLKWSDTRVYEPEIRTRLGRN